MKTKTNLFFLITIVSIILVSCAPVATVVPTDALAGDISDLIVILVVDSFSNVTSKQDTEVEKNCSVTPDGQKYKGEGSGALPIPQGDPHGIFVYKDLISQINPEEFTLVEYEGLDFTGTQSQSLSDSPWIVRYDLYSLKAAQSAGLLVVAVDTDGFNLESIDKYMSATLEKFSGQSDLKLNNTDIPSTSSFVVNMSFVLIPCNPDLILENNLATIMLDYKVKGELIFTEYGDETDFMFKTVQDLKAGYFNNANGTFYDDVNSIEALADLRGRYQALYDKFDPVMLDQVVFDAFILYLSYDPQLGREWQDSKFSDTLRLYLDEKGLEIVYVGAAGNFKDNFSYAPASWNYVVSVSSKPTMQEENNGFTLAKYSNWGEIKMDGVFPFDSRIIGTSFAAPVFSYQIAYYLLGGGQSPCTNSAPALGYATLKDPWDKDQNGNYLVNNLTFNDAMQGYCP